MPIYLKLGKYEGNVTTSGYEKQIECNSIQFGVGRSIMTPTGSALSRESSNASVSEVTFTKSLDNCSTELFASACVGKEAGMKAEFTFIQTGDPGEKYLVITLENVLISGYSASSGGDQPSESISLNFTKISITNTERKVDGTLGDPKTKGFDISTGKSV